MPPLSFIFFYIHRNILKYNQIQIIEKLINQGVPYSYPYYIIIEKYYFQIFRIFYY